MFKKSDSSQDIPPPPPPIEELPDFPKPKEEKEEKKRAKKAPHLPKPAKKPVTMEYVAGREEDRIHQKGREVSAKPLFIQLEDYKVIMEELTYLKDTLEDSLEVINRLEDVKNSEDNLFEKWQKQVKDVHNKLIFVDHTLFEKSMR